MAVTWEDPKKRSTAGVNAGLGGAMQPSGNTVGSNPPKTMADKPYTAPAPPAPTTAPSPGATAPGGELGVPGAYEEWHGKNSGWFDGPTKQGGYWDGVSGHFNQPAPAPEKTQDAYTKYMEELGAPTYGETNAKGVAEDIKGVDYSTRAIDAAGGVAGNNRTSGAYDDLLGSGYYDTNPLADEYEYFQDGTRGLSNIEQMFSGGEGERGLDAIYAREQAKRQRALDDMFASRGLFGGEAALRGSVELGAEINSNKIRDLIQMAKDADAARAGRSAEGRAWAGGIDTSATGRAGQRVSDAGSADAGARDDLKMFIDSLKFGSDEARGTLRDSADIGLAASGETRNRMDGVMGASEGVDRLELDTDKATTDKYSTGAGIASGVDSGELGKVLGGGNAAKTAQDAKEGRLGNMLDDILGMTGAVGDTFQGQADAAVQEFLANGENQINAALARGEIDAQEANRQRTMLQDSADQFMTFLTAKYGGGKTANGGGKTA